MQRARRPGLLLPLMLLAAITLTAAQRATAAELPGCAVVAGPLEVAANGKLERPAPSEQDCLRANALEAKFRQAQVDDFIVRPHGSHRRT